MFIMYYNFCSEIIAVKFATIYASFPLVTPVSCDEFSLIELGIYYLLPKVLSDMVQSHHSR